ncbi:MAG: 1-acyl-sn-glycerol-3-phosphate acyltransferase [Spirochaetales bacterium]|nr:1-acyl-sn-glycerol-3-phosphate acyltransferase [Spirochaetales bacterium]
MQKRPNALLYFLGARIYAPLMCRRKFNLTTSGERVKGPALIISNHTSNHDYKFIGCAVKPARISFLVTYHFFTFKKLAFWLKAIGAIPKYQFTTDLEAMRKIQYVVQKQKGTVYIAPEGTVYASGHLGFISPAIAKMIRFLKVPVYACKIEGAGLGNAKWSTHTHRGKVSIQTHKIIDTDETTSLSRDEIMERINTALAYSEFEYQKREHVLVEGNDKALGFETMFYKCPCCGSEFTLSTDGNDVKCSNCGTVATFQDDFTFKWNTEKQYFENYSQWYDWQYEKILEEVKQPDFKLEDEVDYEIDEPGVDQYVKVGHGVMTFSHDGWDYKGTYRDRDFEEHDEPRSVFIATLTVGKHFQLPNRDGHSRAYAPANPLTSMKWHLASRAMSEILQNQ